MLSGFIDTLPGAAAQGIIWGIMAIGVYITYRILDFADLTVDGSIGTGGAVFAMCTLGGMNVYLSLALAFLAGCVAGFATGIFHTIFGIPPINLDIMGQANQALYSNNQSFLVSMLTPEKSIFVGFAFVLAIIAVLYWFFGTELGHSIRATGNNQNMARANGINTNINKVIALVISNGIVALSGALLAQFQGFSDINMGRGAIVIGLAAVIIGEVIFGKLFKNFALRLFAAVIGGIIYYIVISLVISLGLPANDLKLFSALVVALFLGIPYWKNKVAGKRIKKAGGAANA